MGSENTDPDVSDPVRHLSDAFRHVSASEIRPAKLPVRQFTKCYLPWNEGPRNHHKRLKHHPQGPSNPEIDAWPPASSAAVAGMRAPWGRVLRAPEARALQAQSLQTSRMLPEVKGIALTPIHGSVAGWRFTVSLCRLLGF